MTAQHVHIYILNQIDEHVYILKSVDVFVLFLSHDVITLSHDVRIYFSCDVHLQSSHQGFFCIRRKKNHNITVLHNVRFVNRFHSV